MGREESRDASTNQQKKKIIVHLKLSLQDQNMPCFYSLVLSSAECVLLLLTGLLEHLRYYSGKYTHKSVVVF